MPRHFNPEHNMSAALQELDRHDDDMRSSAERLAEVRRQDAYWERAFHRERYFRPGLDYEDYAPAYCVGYAGHAQYGGSFEEAERSLCANWERIKGASRLAPADAIVAMRAAWERMERGERPALSLVDVGTRRHRLEAESFNPHMAVAR
jgi:hypothetical protein